MTQFDDLEKNIINLKFQLADSTGLGSNNFCVLYLPENSFNTAIVFL